jgi:hypothetical protein
MLASSGRRTRRLRTSPFPEPEAPPQGSEEGKVKQPMRIRSLAEWETQGSNTRQQVETSAVRGGLDRRLKALKSA